MYHIAICDDESASSDSLCRMIKQIADTWSTSPVIHTYSSYASLLAAFSRGTLRYHMVLLNIVMEEAKGMELARRIREADDEISLVLMAPTKEYALQGYEVRALQYLVKPVGMAAMKTILDYDYGRRHPRQYLSVKKRGVWRQIPLDLIIYLETQGRKVAICLSDEYLYASIRLSELEEQLPKDRFIRCHQSYLVNIQHIREMRRNEALTTGGMHIPISRPHLQRVQTAFAGNGYPVCSG